MPGCARPLPPNKATASPALEPLEDRRLLSVTAVANVYSGDAPGRGPQPRLG